jgi:uncharacterized NAD(P)/FAD-binding protein YdhS
VSVETTVAFVPQPTPGETTVVVVGAGASGTLAALHLLRRRARVVLIEERAEVGRGVAYGTKHDVHLLNVPASGMSAYPGDPHHFLSWARSRHPGAHAASFLPRRLYGQYLEWCLRWEEAEAARRGRPFRGTVRAPLTCVTGRATAVLTGPGGPVVQLRDGRAIRGDHVVLALGNSVGAPGRGPGPWLAGPGTVPDPWSSGALEAVPNDGPVVLVGTGLTAVDVVLALHERGARGPIHAVSRHGLLPRPSRVGAPRVTALVHRSPVTGLGTGEPPTTARGLVGAIRAEVRAVTAVGGDWRTAIDGLRPHTQRLWGSLPPEERARLGRHALRYWEVHRHRMAPEVAARIAALQSDGWLVVTPGRVGGVRPRPDGGVEVTVHVRAGDGPTGEHVVDAAALVNCTGSRADLAAAGDPLLDGLFRGGQARPGPLGLGLDTNCEGRLLDAAGRPSPGLWTLGPLRRGALLETTAVPEIREQAAALAVILAGSPTAETGTGFAFEEAL